MAGIDCRVVLVRPRDPNNIGAAARAMKNFGFRDLCVVTPFAPVWDEIVSAPNAGDVLEKVRVCDRLDEAISDCNLVVGTGDPTRLSDAREMFTPADLGRLLQSATYKTALVFGTEKHGLTNEDLCRCHRIMSIPTRPDCPSMNLGQAVAVCLYELTRESRGEVVPPAADVVTAGATEAAVGLTLDVLRLADFVLPGNEPDLVRRVRNSLMKYNLSSYDMNMVCGILRNVRERLQQRENTRQSE